MEIATERLGPRWFTNPRFLQRLGVTFSGIKGVDEAKMIRQVGAKEALWSPKRAKDPSGAF